MKFNKVLCLTLASFTTSINAQIIGGATGLLHMPNAEMQESGTFFMGANFLNEHNNNLVAKFSPELRYNTYNYFFNVTIFPCLELSYVCTLFQGIQDGYWPEETWGRYTNQDRHFVARLRAIKEKQFWEYMPAIVFGVSDPTSGSGGEYTSLNVSGSNNGYFNVWYVAATKHFETKYGEIGVHFAYLYNNRTDYPLNSPAVGVDFKPFLVKGLEVIAEYDAKTVNIGAFYSFYNDHFNFVLELQQCKYISCGFLYKVNLLGGNSWRKKKTQSDKL